MSLQQYNVYDGLTACRVVALANQVGTYVNGPLNNGVGATFTYPTGVLTLDGVTVVQGDSVALINQTAQNENGIYVCTQTGLTGVSCILQRRGDMQCIEQLKVGQWTSIGAGTVSAGSMFVVVEPLPGLFGIDNLLLQAMIPAGSGTASTKTASDNTKAIVASVGSAVVSGRLAKFVDVTGTVDDTAGAAINVGDIQAGVSGSLGRFLAYPAGALSGALILSPVTNASGNFNTVISNAAAIGQAQIISIPDSGAATANFLLSSDVSGSQSLSTSLNITSASNVQISGGGNFIAGTSGAAGWLVSFPAAGANGSLLLKAFNAGGNFTTTISNSVMGQSSVYSIPDVGQATGSLLVSKVVADPGANLISFDITVGQAALAAGGSVILINSSGTKQYKLRSLQLNSGGTNFSGGGGDRLGQVTDGATVYSVIPAATMQALTNEQWGVGVGLPNPAAAAINTSTVAGADLVFMYSGGTTDYTAGSLVISGIVERVA